MNRIGKVTIIGTVIVVIAAGILYLQKDSSKDTIANITLNKNDIYNNIESSTELKKVQFNTAEEMFEYTEKISSIDDVAEATNFIEDFLNKCSLGKPEVMLTYFNTNLWDNILENNLFPFYDPSNAISFEAKDIAVSETKETYVYNVEYTVVARDTETNEVLAELNREDKFELYKDFEVIKIVNYTRKTTSEKYY